MAQSDAIRWGMIGCGDVTEKKSAPAYHITPGFSLHGVTSRTLDRAQSYASRHGISQVYSDAKALIESPEIDAVYIATPPDSHLDYALMTAQAGKPCCVEKPLAVNYSQAKRMQDAFDAKGLPLFVAYYRRCLPGFVNIKTWLDEGCIGQVRHIDWQYTRSPSERDQQGEENWRTDARIAPGGYFDDLASHGLNIVTFLLGEVEKVTGIASNQAGLYSAKDAIVAHMQFKQGATGTGCWNFVSQIYQDKITISGSEGQIEFGVFSDQKAKLIDGSGHLQLCDMPKPEPIQGHFVQAMVEHLQGRANHPSLGDSAAHTQWIMDSILTSWV